MISSQLKHPCIGYCEITPAAGRCNGCGHKFDEVLAWGHLSRQRRDAAEKEAKAFLAARSRPGVRVRKDDDDGDTTAYEDAFP